jgi:ABC-type branched-subunit amino acid transport system substrate-binding protein
MEPRGVCIAILLACGCGGGQPRITLGAVISQTGSPASPGLNHLQAVQLAVDEINGAGGVLGRTLEVVNRDDRGDAGQAASDASQLIDTYRVPAIIGPIISPSVITMEPIVSARKVVLISGSTTSPDLTAISPYFFRTTPSDALQAPVLAKRAVANKLQRVAVIAVPGAYGSGLSRAFIAAYQALGGTIVFSQQYTPGQSNYVDLLSQVFVTNPDGVLLVAYLQDGAQIVRDYANNFQFNAAFWLFTDALKYSSFIDGVGAGNFSFMHEGTATTIPTSAAAARFAAAFAARYGEQPEGHTPSFYDATYLVALALERAKQVDGTALRDNLRAVANPPGTLVGPEEWASALGTLGGGGEVDYDGASGTVALDANGDVSAAYDIWKVVNGQLTTVQSNVSP